MTLRRELDLHLTRRQLFGLTARGIGGAALGSLLGLDGLLATPGAQAVRDAKTGGLAGLPHFAPKAKRVIFLHQSGGPSQLETFDYKPGLLKYQGTQIPDSVRQGQRVAQAMGQSALLVANSAYGFAQHGKSGTWVSELLPHIANIVDDITVIKTMYTDAINHDPAITFIQTGFQQPGRPSMGAWLSYGLGSENQTLPTFVVLLSQANAINADQPLFSRLWGSGFLPSNYQGVRFGSGSAPVLYLDDPPGISKTTRRQMLDAMAALNEMKHAAYGDPETVGAVSGADAGRCSADRARGTSCTAAVGRAPAAGAITSPNRAKNLAASCFAVASTSEPPNCANRDRFNNRIINADKDRQPVAG